MDQTEIYRGPCPSHGDWERFVAGVIDSPAAKASREEHLARCPDCRAFVESLSPGDARTADFQRDDGTVVFGGNRPSPTAISSSDVGDYEILVEIARGGMGIVYKARHRKLGRLAAVKLIKSGDIAGDEEVRRFQAEAAAASQLDHPNIVPVFEAGEHHGQHYMALALVDGPSLWNRVRETPLEPNEAAALLETVARAIQFAHDRGIIHRDLKPQNILITADGVPKVTDFGLAKRIHGDSNLTGTGMPLGTPSYMPPEQAAGQQDKIGPRSDVYALGATLYAMLTGRPPFQAANAMAAVLQVLQSEPVSPRDLNPGIPRDLETICLKCLSKRSNDRYASAEDLADDLRRFLTHQPIAARPTGSFEHLVKWVQRQPALAGLLAASLIAALALVAVGVGRFYGNELAATNDRLRTALNESERAKNAEEEQKRQTAKALDNVERYLYANRISLAQREIERRDFGRADQLLNECKPPFRGWEWYHLRANISASRELEHGHFDAVHLTALSPNGKFVATGCRDGKVRLHTFTEFKQLDVPQGTSPTTALAFGADDTLYVGHESGAVAAWRITFGAFGDLRDATIKPLFSRDIGQSVSTLVAHTNGMVFASGAAKDDSPLSNWNSSDTSAPVDWPGHAGGVAAMTLSPSGRLLASGGNDRRVRVRRVPDGEELYQLETPGVPRGLAFSVDDRVLVVAIDRLSIGTEIKLIDAVRGSEIGSQSQAWHSLRGLMLGKDETEVCLAVDGRVRKWNARTNEFATFHTGDPPVLSAAFHRSTGQLVTAGGYVGQPGSVSVWNRHEPPAPRAMGKPGTHWNAITLNSDGTRLVTAEEHGPVRLWDVSQNRAILTLAAESQSATAVALNPNQQRIVTCGSDGKVRWWDGRNGALVKTAEAGGQTIRGARFARNGKWLVTLGEDARLWREGGELAATIAGPITSCQFGKSNDAGLEVVVGREDRLQWIDPLSGRELGSLPIPSRRIVADPAGDNLVVEDLVGTVHLIDGDERRAMGRLAGEVMSPNILDYDASGRRIITAGVGGIALWDPRTGLEIGRFLNDGKAYVAASLQDRSLVAAEAEGRILVWKY